MSAQVLVCSHHSHVSQACLVVPGSALTYKHAVAGTLAYGLQVSLGSHLQAHSTWREVWP